MTNELGRPLPALLCVVSLLAACSSVSLPQREGVALYRSKCGACHRLYAPAQIRAERWSVTFERMWKRAHLSPAEAAAIRAYADPDIVPRLVSSHPSSP